MGGASHTRWVLEIGQILAQREYNVTFLTRDDHIKFAEPFSSIGAHSIGPNVYSENTQVFEDIRHMSQHRIMGKIRTMANNAYQKEYPIFDQIFTSEPPDIVICDSLSISCIDAAHAHQLPVVITSTFMLHPDVNVPYINNLGDTAHWISIDMSLWQRFAHKYVEKIKWIYFNYSGLRTLDRLREHYGNNPLGFDRFRHWKSSLSLVNSFFGFAPSQPLTPLTHFVGPVFAEHQATLGENEKRFLDNHRRVAYVAFGQVMRPECHGFQVIFDALVEQVAQNRLDAVIWVGLSRSLTDPGCAHIQRSLPKTFMSLDWASQFAILQHPSTILFITHGGAESVHEALFHGVPLILHPFHGDQPRNSYSLERAGVARVHDRHSCTVEMVSGHMKDILEDVDGYYSKNTNRMKALARIGSKRKYAAADLIEEHLLTAVNGIPLHRQDIGRNISWIKRYDIDLHLVVASLLLILCLSLYKICILFWFGASKSKRGKED